MGLLQNIMGMVLGKKGANSVVEQGLESLVNGNLQEIVEMIIKKLKLNISIPDIAKQLQQPEKLVSQVSEIANKVGLDADVEKILEQVMKNLPGLK